MSADLKERYPKMGVSPRQLWNMKKFYERYAGHDVKVLRSVALEDMGKPIGVADYQLIVPKEKLQKVLADEIKAFSEEKEKKIN